jgi:hypothetical protein
MLALSPGHNPVDGFPKRFGQINISQRMSEESRAIRDEPIEKKQNCAVQRSFLALQRKFGLHLRDRHSYPHRDGAREIRVSRALS